MSKIHTENYVIGHVCDDTVEIAHRIDDGNRKLALLTNVPRIVQLGQAANRCENTVGDIVEKLRAIRSELLTCRATMMAIAIDMSEGTVADTPAWLDLRTTQLARRAAKLEITDDVLCELIDWAEKLTKGDERGRT